MTQVYIRDIADVFGTRYCVRGARAFFSRHGLDWRQFVREGIDSEALLATGDAMAARVVRAVEASRGQE